MERRVPDPRAVRLWYAGIFFVGIYWSNSLLSGSFNPHFMYLGPLIICIGVALHLSEPIGAGVLCEALNLFATFGIGVGIGGGLQILGAVQFFRDRLTFLGR